MSVIVNYKYAESVDRKSHWLLHAGTQDIGQWISRSDYQRALAIEFKPQHVNFSREHKMSIY